MDKAKNKYKVLVAEGNWDLNSRVGATSLTALQTEVRELRKKLKGKGKRDSPGGKRKRTKTLGKKNKVDITRKPKDIKKPLFIGNDKKPWYWCCPETGGKCPGLLRRHKPSECEGRCKNEVKTGTKPVTKKLRLEAAQAVMVGDISQEELEKNLDELDLSSIDSDGWERSKGDGKE